MRLGLAADVVVVLALGAGLSLAHADSEPARVPFKGSNYFFLRQNPVAAPNITPAVPRAELADRLVVGDDFFKAFATYEIVRRQPMSDNDLIVPWIAANANRLQPTFLAELAFRLFAIDRSTALDWYAIALARARYHAALCTDSSTFPTSDFDIDIASTGSAAGPALPNFLSEHPEALADAYARVLHRPDLLDDDVSPEWNCSSGIMIGGGPLPPGAVISHASIVRPASEWASIRQAIWEDAAAMASGMPQLAGPPRPGRVIKRLLGKGAVGAAWSPDGTVIATTSDDRIELWNPETGERLREMVPQSDILGPPVFTGDGRYLYVAEGQRSLTRPEALIRLSDVHTGARGGSISALNGHGLFAFDPNRRILAVDMTGYGEDCVIFLYDARNWRRFGTLVTGRDDEPSALALAPGGTNLAVALEKEIAVFDVERRVLLRRIEAVRTGERARLLSLAYSPDGSYLATDVLLFADPNAGARSSSSVRIWNAANGSLARSLPGDLGGLGWTRDGRFITMGERAGMLHFWNAESGDATAVATTMKWHAPDSFSPDGKRLVVPARGGAAIVEIEP